MAGFGAATVLLTLPVAIHPTRTLPSDLLDTLLNAWIIGWDASRLPHLLGGVWNAPIFFPYHDTLAFSENLFGLLFVAPVYWISGNAVLSYNVAFLASFAIAGIGMYLLVRSLTGSIAAAVVAGTAYAFAPYRFVQISHVQMVATGWIPVALWGLHEYFETGARRWLAVFVGAYILQATSNSYVAYYAAVAVAIVAAAGVWRLRGRRLRAVGELAVAGAAVLIVLAPVGSAYFRVKRDYGLVRSVADIAGRSADVRAYVVAKDSIGLGRWLPTAVKSDPEKELFPGVFPVLLAAIGLAFARPRDRRTVRLYGVVALAGFLFSLGPWVRVWGHIVTRHGPYDWLLHVVPGMAGMRVPARFAIIFVAGLSVLAGVGAMIVTARLGRRGRAIAVAGLLLAIAADGFTVPLPIERYPGSGRPADRGIAAWLRARPAGAVLHLPALTFNYQELNWQYATLMHGHPIVNGYSGYDTPLQLLLRHPRSPLHDWAHYPAVVRMLRALGVRYVVVHRDDYNLTQSEALEPDRTLQGLRASGQTMAETGVLDATAFELEPWKAPPEDPGVRIGGRDLTVTVSEGEDRGAALVDGDLDSRWIGHQGGGSWIAARLAAPADVARVGLVLAARSVGDYPREIQVESTDGQGRSRVLYRDSPYPELIRGFIANAEYPVISIVLPPNETAILTVRETAVDPDAWWSVHELQLWRRERPLAGPEPTR